MIKQKIFLIYILILLTGCGYNPIYSSKNISDIEINKVVILGDKKINRKLLSLLNIKESNQLKNSYVLNIETKKIKKITAKDKIGNISIYNIYLEAVVTLKQDDNIKTKTFNSSFSYNNQKNKFELSRKEDNIESGLIENIAERIILFIYS